VFSQRFTAICLLVLHGVLAAVGPYWHRHEHTCGHCESHFAVQAASLEHGHDHAGRSECGSSKSCCQGTRATGTCSAELPSECCRSDQSGGQTTHPEPTTPCAPHSHESQAPGPKLAGQLSLEADGEHGPCAICAYFAQAQVFAAPVLVSLSHLRVYAIEAACCQPPRMALSFCQARGPPCCA
jgi:hypothetical protein